MARPCSCTVCTDGLYGAYTVLVHQAQADGNTARRQEAMHFLAAIGPSAGSIGADGRSPGDALAAPMLTRLYGEEAAEPPRPQPVIPATEDGNPS